MKRWMWTLAAVVVIGGTFAAVTVRGEGQAPAAAQAPAGAAKAKIGDTIECAMDGMKMPLEAETPSTEYGGKTYYFCSKEEIKDFLADPDKHIKH